MAHYRIKKGYEIPITGKPNRELTELPAPTFVGVNPIAFPGIKPKLKVAVNDRVKIGSPLFFDKQDPRILFGSPGCGKVTAIDYGPRRVIEQIVIACDEQRDFESNEATGMDDIASVDRQDMVTRLLEGCVWPFIRQRPFNKIADPSGIPKSIFVNFMDSAPLANQPSFSLAGQEEAFQAGLTALKVLSGGPLFVVSDKQMAAGFKAFSGAVYHTFEGKHPTGLVSTHIGKLDPINHGEIVWYLNARDAVAIGRFLLTGQYPIDRVVAVCGPGAEKRGYYKTQLGVQLSLVAGKPEDPGAKRYISGNLLTGKHSEPDAFLDFYDDLVTIIPEGKERHFMGWIMPGLSKWTFGRTMLSSFLPGKKFKMNTNLNGGYRAIVQSGLYERVVALDIHPEFLIKAAKAHDIEAMEKLGMFEVDPEDFALCAYVCPSKTEVCSIIQDGLDLMEREG